METDKMETIGSTSRESALASEIVEELVATLLNIQIHYKAHPKVNESLAKILKKLKEFFEGKDAFRILTKGRIIYLEEAPLVGAALSSARLIDYLKSLGTPGFEILKSVTIGDIEVFVDLLSSGKEARPNDYLLSKECNTIKFIGWEEVTELEEEEQVGSESEKDALAIYQDTISFLQDSTVKACRNDEISIEEAKEKSMWIISSIHKDPVAMYKYSKYTVFDPLSLSHPCRVAVILLDFMGRHVKDRDLLERMGAAALLHDIGKAWVPLEIIRKKGELSLEERIEMEKHPINGVEILCKPGKIDPLILSGVFGHHRDYNGKGGYPELNPGTPVSAMARVLRICDVFEALAAPRPYKKPFSPIQAWQVMFSMKSQLDPRLLKLFFSSMGLYPVGTKVTLSNSKKGEVTGQTSVPDRPLVTILEGIDKGGIIDLSEPQNRQLRIKDLLE